MNTRKFRALLLSLCLPALACAADGNPPEPVPTTNPIGLYHCLRTFDFDERKLGNFETTPMYWRRFEGDGLPAYSFGALDDAFGHNAPPSFKLTLRGGNTGYEYTHSDIMVFADSDYVVEAWVRAENLEYARAFVVANLVDSYGRPLPGAARVSQLVSAPPGEEPAWQRVELTISGDCPNARALRIQLWAAQRDNWHASEGEVDPIIRHDVQAQVWFDDLAVYRMPCVRFGLTHPGGLALPGQRAAITLNINNTIGNPIHADIEIHSEAGELVANFSRPVERRGEHEELFDLPDLPPGLYRAHLNLRAGQDTTVRRSAQFAILPELPASEAPIHPDLGVELGRWPNAGETGAAELARALGAAAVKIGVPLIGTPTDEADAEYVRQLTALERRLTQQRTQLTAVMCAPQAGDTPIPQHSIQWMLALDETWESRAAPVFAQFGGYVLSWQLGDERFELCAPSRWTSRMFADVHNVLTRFTAAPELVLPRSLLEPNCFAPADDAVFATNTNSVMPALRTYSYWISADMPARAFIGLLSGLEEAADAEPRGRMQRWLRLDFDADANLSETERAKDLVRRFALAKAANADRLYVPAPFEPASNGTDWQPTRDFIALRTLFAYLNGSRAVGALNIDDNAIALLFAGQRDCMVLWTWEEGPERTLELYAGPEAHTVELDARRAPLQRRGALARVPLRSMPLLVADVDIPLLLLQDSFSLSPAAVQLHDPEPRPVLRLTNRYSVELSGSIRLTGPAAWDISPNPVSLVLQPGEALEQTLTITLPPRQIASSQDLAVDVHVDRPEPADLHFDLQLEMMLKDLATQNKAWWEGDDLLIEHVLRNMGDRPVSFSGFCQGPNRPRLERAFLNIPAGEEQRQRYRFRNARDLAGQRLWLGIQEIAGHRTLDQLVLAPP